MNFRDQRRRRMDASLDLTPLIDCVFLLLIFFLVTATFAQQQEQSIVPVELPVGSTGESSSATEQVTIFLEADGTYSLRRGEDDVQSGMQRGDLEAALRGLYTAAPDTALFLRGDREARYGEVMRLLDIAREIGFRRVFNVIQSPD
jgi:biopolymer transport protein ExbD